MEIRRDDEQRKSKGAEIYRVKAKHVQQIAHHLVKGIVAATYFLHSLYCEELIN
jgi:hypothetical protein